MTLQDQIKALIKELDSPGADRDEIQQRIEELKKQLKFLENHH